MITMCIYIGLSDGEVEGELKDSVNLLFSGGFLSTVFWVSDCAYINQPTI